jgi:hypothetical protein
MEPTFRKTSIRIWTPLLEKFGQRIESACLRRDAYLTKVLEDEIDELDSATELPNSEAARSFIAAHLDTVPRKLVTLTLPEDAVKRLDDICDRKRIVRDGFFNRLLYLLSAEHRQITRLFFDDDGEWVQDLLERTDFGPSAAGHLLDPIPEYRNPLQTVREGLWVARDRMASNPSTATEADAWLAQHSIYGLTIRDRQFGRSDLYGLSISLPDSLVPGTSDYDASARLLDEFVSHTEEPSS